MTSSKLPKIIDIHNIIDSFETLVDIYKLDKYKIKNVFVNKKVKIYLEKHKDANDEFEIKFDEIMQNWDKKAIIYQYPIINNHKQYILQFAKYQFYYIVMSDDVYIYDVNSKNNTLSYDLKNHNKPQQPNWPKRKKIFEPKLYGNELNI